MRIGIDCRLWKESGVGRYIRNLVLNLQKIDKKNEYVLFILNKDEENVKFAVRSSQFAVRIADIKWHTLNEQIKFPQILNKENLDLVHFPYQSIPFFYNRPFVITIHDLIPYHFSTSIASTLPYPLYYLKLFGYKFAISQAAKKARKIIAVSKATKDEIVDHLRIDKNKIEVTYEGVDSAIQNSKLKIQNCNSKFKIKDYFLYVGNAYPHKNLDRLLDAFSLFCHSELVSESRGINLVLVGKEDYFHKRLQEKAERMGLSKKVIFKQNVSDEELSNLYKNALASITPSLMEGFGLPALEAMANNCLVLASDIPALREVCGDAAIYFNPLDINDLTGKLTMITLHVTEYGGLGEIKRRGIEMAKKFSWRKTAEETLRIYNNVLSS